MFSVVVHLLHLTSVGPYTLLLACKQYGPTIAQLLEDREWRYIKRDDYLPVFCHVSNVHRDFIFR